MGREPIGGLMPIEAELMRERASSLKRVAGKLEDLLEALAGVGRELDDAVGIARRALLQEHARLRAEAERYRWYLIVQREAMGMYEHGDVLQIYALPPERR